MGLLDRGLQAIGALAFDGEERRSWDSHAAGFGDAGGDDAGEGCAHLSVSAKDGGGLYFLFGLRDFGVNLGALAAAIW